MRNYDDELKKRVAFIQNMLVKTDTDGIVFGNSGGKDSALVGILCKKACNNTLGLIMPCGSKRNFESDMEDALKVADKFSIETKVFDLSILRSGLIDILKPEISISDTASANIAPRLRMTTLYAVAASRNSLVAGTDNRSEWHMGYFTKWGDGAYDFNPIVDLTVTEIYEFLEFIGVPASIIDKAPSAGLFEGQTDEDEMGVSYKSIDDFLLYGKVSDTDKAKIERFHKTSSHKRRLPLMYGE